MSTITASLIEATIYESKTVSPTNSWHLINLGVNAPVETVTRRFSEFPANIRALIVDRDGPTGTDHWFTIAFYEERCYGQTQNGPRDHRLYIFPVSGKPVELITAKVGCEHDYAETVLGRCYRRYNCHKCGRSFSVDSGD